MKVKTIYQLASTIMALVMVLGNTIPTHAAPSEQTTTPSIYWGAMVDGKVPSTTNLAGVFATFETRSNKRMSIIHWGQPWKMSDGSWGEFQTTYFQNVRNHGSIPMINWSSHKLGGGVAQADFQLRDIYNGNYDTYIRRWATAAKTWGHPLFMRFNHEMNGWWYPWGEGKLSSGGAIVNGNSAGDFIRAWRHVHGIFRSVGATNVTWVWAPNHMGTSTQYPALSTIYPGDAYVDWTGFSVYNKYSTWAGLNPLLTGSGGMTWYRNSYSSMLTVAPNKPIMLAEWASLEAGDGGTKKAAWITDALTTQIPINFPKIKAVVWMNWEVSPGKSYPIQSSTAATTAWKVGISASRYANNRYANLNTSPIPVPASVSAAQMSNVPELLSDEAAAVLSSPMEAPATAIASPTTLPATLEPSPTLPPATPTTLPTEIPATIEASPTTTAVTILGSADTYIDSADPLSEAGGESTTLFVNASPTQTTFLKFDLAALAGRTISTVMLRIKTTSDANAGSVDGSNIKLVDDVSWKEKRMSFERTVEISATVLGTIPTDTVPDTWYEITLDPASLQQSAGGMLSLAVEATGSDDLLLYSREAADQPQLVITYQE